MMDGIYYSNDSVIDKHEYWQVYNPFSREFENIFFKKCVKNKNTTYLSKIFPDKNFIESMELIPTTELVVCRLRIQKILCDETKTNTEKAKEITDILKSYPIESILFSLQSGSNDEYLMKEFIEDMKPIIKGLDKKLYKSIFTEKDAILSLAKHCIKNKNNEEIDVNEL